MDSALGGNLEEQVLRVLKLTCIQGEGIGSRVLLLREILPSSSLVRIER
jgi:hypothetical protein